MRTGEKVLKIINLPSSIKPTHSLIINKYTRYTPKHLHARSGIERDRCRDRRLRGDWIPQTISNYNLKSPNMQLRGEISRHHFSRRRTVVVIKARDRALIYETSKPNIGRLILTNIITLINTSYTAKWLIITFHKSALSKYCNLILRLHVTEKYSEIAVKDPRTSSTNFLLWKIQTRLGMERDVGMDIFPVRTLIMPPFKF